MSLCQIMFLKESDPYFLTSWSNSLSCDSDLEIKGFVPILSLKDPRLEIRPSAIRLSLH